MPICHLQDRSLVHLSGPDVRPFLQGLITQDIQALTPDTPLYSGLLSPQGKALFQLFIFADGEDVLLDVDSAQSEALIKRLTMFRLRRDVQIRAEEAMQIWQGWGENLSHTPDPRHADAGYRFLSAGESATGSFDDWQKHRLSLGLPNAAEIGQDELLWLETNARELNGVSFTKGCYTGQENTARMHHRDKLRKRLLPVRFSADLEIGTPVMVGEREAGVVRGEPVDGVAMTMFRVEYIDQSLEAGGQAAEVIRPVWLPAE